jgi:hypothetical protein
VFFVENSGFQLLKIDVSVGVFALGDMKKMKTHSVGPKQKKDGFPIQFQKQVFEYERKFKRK